MLTARSWDELPFPGTYKNGRREEMSKITIGNFSISAHNYHRSTILMSKYVFWGAKHDRIGFEQLTQHQKGQNPRWPQIFLEIYHLPGSIFFCILLIIGSSTMILHG